MADTPRTVPTLITAAADETAGTYNNQDLRDLIVSSRNIVGAAVSAAGTTQGTATPLTTHTVVVTVCALNAGVIATLPYHKIYSRGANPVLFYPVSGNNFEGQGANIAVSVPVGGTVELVMTSATQGYVG